MAKPNPIIAGDLAVEFGQPNRGWDKSHGMYIAGRAYLDEADQTAAQMEAKWGADRLRLLVGVELREKFDRQRYLLNQAIWHGRQLEDVRLQSMRMVNAWLALDKAATAAGAQQLAPQVWEIALADGTVAAIVPDGAQAHHVVSSGRAVNVYTLEEIGRLLTAMPTVAKIKDQWPGATVTSVKRTVDDPLLNLHDTSRALDDEIPW